jgi:hypothetical protein
MASRSADAAEKSDTAWEAPKPFSKLSIGMAVGAVLVLNLPMLHYFIFRSAPAAPVTIPYQDDYTRPETVQENYWSSGGLWHVESGQLASPGVKNNPLWLKAKLPRDVAVEFDARSQSPEGDVKCEIFGDGTDHASGYVLIHGGWNNSLSIIARLDEHGAAVPASPTGPFAADARVRVEQRGFPVQVGKTTHWRIERKGQRISWFLDGQPYMYFDDPAPLEGPGHDRFAFSSWEAQLYFDNLKITPL